ncbi:hypothetical protein C1646_755510 [Rhizophagus diaphanus]|nr:hypothetical protein C1646_755510 [Rhizophagus diaphanus] [Rhizophagus sp. MUCL 43196]
MALQRNFTSAMQNGFGEIGFGEVDFDEKPGERFGYVVIENDLSQKVGDKMEYPELSFEIVLEAFKKLKDGNKVGGNKADDGRVAIGAYNHIAKRTNESIIIYGNKKPFIKSAVGVLEGLLHQIILYLPNIVL